MADYEGQREMSDRQPGLSRDLLKLLDGVVTVGVLGSSAKPRRGCRPRISRSNPVATSASRRTSAIGTSDSRNRLVVS